MKIDRSDALFYGFAVWTVMATAFVGTVWYKRDFGRQLSSASAAPRRVADSQKYAARGYSFGPKNAPVTLVVFSDFQCPFCRRFASIVDSLRAHDATVRVVERHFPLEGLHPEAFQAALAAECAREQGAYEPMRHELFTEQQLVRDEAWDRLAKLAGVADASVFSACVSQARHTDAVRTDIAAGKELEIRGTPSMLIGDSLYPGGMELASLKARISAAGSRKR